MMAVKADYGAKEVADQLHESLRRYIEAQYPIRDTGVIEERHALLKEMGTIGQKPYVETTPTYATDRIYSELDLPAPIGQTLTDFAGWKPSIGIFPRPYVHQAQALTTFFKEDKDLIVSTGTGSGKTETFLLPILGGLLLEAHERPSSFNLPGCRALLLYPMNALVSDQVSRLRRLFGDERLKRHFRDLYNRFPRFGMYTSRTPYPGPRYPEKDRQYIEPLLNYYLELESSNGIGQKQNNAQLVRELQEHGRWPAKDLRGFYGTKGKPWYDRLKTQPGGSEFLTRHEMQQQCPDILVTNYSMLEYMLLRPIERSIFQQTREWLAKDTRNNFILVLDEAHMYRGVGGAEVALLIRRLQARLGIPRERFRCILTSASLGSGHDVEKEALTFATSLTGHPASKVTSFRLIQGQREQRPSVRPATAHEGGTFADFDLPTFFRRAEDQVSACGAIADLSGRLGWPMPPIPAPLDASDDVKVKAEANLRAYLYDHLYGFGPLEYVIQETAAHATAFDELAACLFPHVEQTQAERALAALLALGTYAHKDERVLLPTRVHLFFRGLSSLYACINPQCDQRRHRPGDTLLLGRLYTEPRTHCACSSQARVYELYAHRECGAAFLRVFGRGKDADFYWHEQGGDIENVGQPLDETLLFIEEPHPQMLGKVECIWFDIATGRVTTQRPDNPVGYRQCWRPMSRTAGSTKHSSSKKVKEHTPSEQNDEGVPDQLPFRVCPACTRRTGHKIVDLATKGEQPFANLVREQFVLQPAVKESDEQYPNGGRKVLLFSDGRQKAARLARDLPREVEFDSFRQTLVLAVQRLNEIECDATLDQRLYMAFVSVCSDFNLHFFDQNDQSQEILLRDIGLYRDMYDADLASFISERQLTPPTQYKRALLRQLSDQYYSLYSICAAIVEPSSSAIRRLKQQLMSLPEAFLRNHLRSVAITWIEILLERTTFDSSIPEEARWDIDEYFKALPSTQSIKDVDRLLQNAGVLDVTQMAMIHEKLSKVLAQEVAGALYLDPSVLKLVLALNDTWLQCMACGLVQYRAPFGTCVHCGIGRLEQRRPDHPYMQSQKGYFLDPLRAVLAGGKPVHITAEEHTAQLSQRDVGVIHATTEEHELRFQNVMLGQKKPPVDVLSCTTTMEVGIDIGSLTAIGLRNVPPQRENYQQRAGRAGRRGSAVSTVVTYAQGGPHDSYYYEHPGEIISGKPREPMVKVDNHRLASRHIHSFLIQTFFHQQLDRFPPQEQQQQITQRTHVMSALGTASSFFGGIGIFSLPTFREWLETNVVALYASLGDAIARWLPDELCLPTITDERERFNWKRAFVIDAAKAFIASLEDLVVRYTNCPFPTASELHALSGQQPDGGQPERGLDDEQSSNLLLNVLFDRGLLPSYAFPTDLCAFSVFEQEKNRVIIKERPQQSKIQALSEYAPGRLLVINKKTYRVGGIYDENAHAKAPSLQTMKPYVSCPQCTYVREKSLSRGQETCPICKATLEEREMLDPPGFSPEGGKSLNEQDRDQELSYATIAQFPTPVEPDQFIWKRETFKYLRYTHAENRRLVVVNKGPGEKGFRLCEDCGAIWPESQQASQQNKAHARPFLVDARTFHRRGMTKMCNGHVRKVPLYLGYSFSTDLLLLRFSLSAPIAYHPQHPWLHDALRTMAEAISLAASRHLDVDPGELSANYRLVPPMPGEDTDAKTFIDVYLFDTASGGAGYAAEAGEHLPQIVHGALTLLDKCPGNCERSCTKCLRYYGNRYWHERLDRHLAAQLLAYAKDKSLPSVPNIVMQSTAFVPLKRFLELEGYTCALGVPIGNIEVPLLITADQSRRMKEPVAVGIHPALLDRDAAELTHPLQVLDERHNVQVVLLNDYVVARDLPTASQQLLREAGLM